MLQTWILFYNILIRKGLCSNNKINSKGNANFLINTSPQYAMYFGASFWNHYWPVRLFVSLLGIIALFYNKIILYEVMDN